MFMMNLDEVKEMIQYCKENHVKKLQIGSVNIELSDLAFLQEEFQTPKKEESSSNKTLVDTNLTEQDKEDSELLFWSSNS